MQIRRGIDNVFIKAGPIRSQARRQILNFVSHSSQLQQVQLPISRLQNLVTRQVRHSLFNQHRAGLLQTPFQRGLTNLTGIKNSRRSSRTLASAFSQVVRREFITHRNQVNRITSTGTLSKLDPNLFSHRFKKITGQQINIFKDSGTTQKDSADKCLFDTHYQVLFSGFTNHSSITRVE